MGSHRTPDPLTPSDSPAGPNVRWSVILGVWMVPALLASFETYVFWRVGGRPYPFWRAPLAEGPPWLVYAALTPGVLALGARLPLHGPRRARHLAVHLALALLAGGLYALAAAGTALAFAPTPMPLAFGVLVGRWFLSSLPLTMLAYFGIVIAGAALRSLSEARRRESEAARLSVQLSDARLNALKMQLHPHFLFNTLNAITVLARDRDSEGVVRMLELLSDLLRDVLRTDATPLIVLDDELDFVRRYLAIEKIRFTDRVVVVESTAPEIGHCLVPAFVLQPLVENALRHSIGLRVGGGTITISARRISDTDVELCVEDDGVGLPADWRGDDDYGIGLANTASRLRELFGARGELVVTRRPAGGTRAAVRMPYDARALVPILHAPALRGAPAPAALT